MVRWTLNKLLNTMMALVMVKIGAEEPGGASLRHE